MNWISEHFRRYRQRTPWDFCWRIAIEGTIVALAVAFILDLLGVAERKIDISVPVLLVAGIVIAPLIETLIFQAFPIWIARLFKAKMSVQIICSVIPFLAAHAIEGLATGLAAGLITGSYLAFTYAHWREQKRWTAFWTTAVSHSIHNAIVITLALTLGEI
jgi:hypothetical protein